MTTKFKNENILLVILMFLYSAITIIMKYASMEDHITTKFIVLYCAVVVFFGIYAIGWQKILEKVEISKALAFKPLSVIFGLVWSHLLFKEELSLKVCIGTIFVLIGLFMESEQYE